MQITIFQNRRVYLEKNNFGVNNENKVETLEFAFPEGLDNFTKIIEFNANGTKFADVINGKSYVLTNAVTQHGNLEAQIVFKDMSNNEVFKSEIFQMKFLNAINATEQMEEEKKDIITVLVEEAVEGTKQELKDYVDNYVAEAVTNAIGGEY